MSGWRWPWGSRLSWTGAAARTVWQSREAGSPAEVVQPHLPDRVRGGHNAVMGTTLYAWRAGWRRSWQLALAVALIGGLLGAAAMAALAGARRTDSAYGRYLQAAKASDVMIDVPGPLLSVVRQVEGLHGRLSAAAWLGLNAEPVIDGKLIRPSRRTRLPRAWVASTSGRTR